jgi:RHS repeat-associated protein
LKGADFSSWSGSAWTVTPAYDLGGASYNGILYDAAGNLTALQRNRETGTVLDNLTYTIAPTSNRLTQIGDAVDGTPESWDAEDGSFTYDPNGNLLTAPAAPYSIATAITYNYQNLPVSLTSGANTATYRYDDAGQRITKQVNGGNTEVYLREGPTTLGVFTVNSAGTPLSSYFNILWDDRVVGRQTILPTATRTYNHFDALGSTRAVVLSTTGAVVESYDFEPWGLLMAGRTLASATPTKEGFTGKEQDAETGLDYFGARYYMPAIGRWAAVDPSADATPEWSPYNYVLDNPGTHTDPDGRQVPLYDLFKAGLRLAGTGNSDFAAASRGTVSGLERVEASVMSPVTDPVGTLAGIGTMARAGQGDVDAQAQITAGVVSAVDERVDRWNNGGIEGKFDVAWEGALTLASMVGPAAISKVGAAGEVMNVSRLPAAAAGKTTGLLRTAAGETPLVSGVAGPAASMPRGAPGFDIVTRTHVEGHAAATMHQTGARAGTLVISKAPCASCSRLLPRMLPSGSQLRIVSVQGLDKIFKSQM